MTRKKWLRLRRRRPELFKGLRLQSWETFSPEQLNIMRKTKVSAVVAALTANVFAPVEYLWTWCPSKKHGLEPCMILHQRTKVENRVDGSP